MTQIFHGTGVYALAAIIDSNELLEGIHWGKPGEPHGPRLSRDLQVASSFIIYNMHWGEGGVLVLDRDLLTRDYQIETYTDRGYDGTSWGQDEREEVILSQAVKNLDRYLVSILCDPAVIAHALHDATMEDAMSECGWALDVTGDSGKALARSQLERLAAHPKLNAGVSREELPRHGNWDLPAVENISASSQTAPATSVTSLANAMLTPVSPNSMYNMDTDNTSLDDGIRIFDEDDEYHSLEDLLTGLTEGRLLAHARVVDGTDLRYGIDPSAGALLTTTEAWQTAVDEHGAGPELTFFAEDLSWANSDVLRTVRNANATDLEVVFVRKNVTIQKSLGDGKVELADGSVVPYGMSPLANYEDPLYAEEPAGVERGDWYTRKTQDVVGVVPAQSLTHAHQMDLPHASGPDGETDQWFSGSQVVDSHGQPLLVYHGTKAKGLIEFDKSKIKSGVGFWFTSDRTAADGYTYGIDHKGRQTQGEVIEAYLSIKNPARTLDEYWEGKDQSGNPYDGYIPEAGEGVFVAFDPEQIRIINKHDSTLDAAASTSDSPVHPAPRRLKM